MEKNWLKEYKINQNQKNREKVLNAIVHLKKATPSQILEFIQKECEKETEDYFSTNSNLSFTPEEFQKKISELSIKIRTLFNILDSLTKENLTSNNGNGVYSVNGIVYNNKFIFFPDEFGQSIVYQLGSFFPVTIEESLLQYVNRFGLYIIFVFLKLIDFIYKNENENTIYKNLSMDKWLENAIPLKLMFDLFTNLYFDNKNNTTTTNLKILNGLNTILDKQYPSLYKEFNNIIKENKKFKEKIKEKNKKYKLSMEKYRKEMKRRGNIKGYKPKTIIIKGKLNTIRGRVAPRDWKEQLEKLAKD